METIAATYPSLEEHIVHLLDGTILFKVGSPYHEYLKYKECKEKCEYINKFNAIHSASSRNKYLDLKTGIHPYYIPSDIWPYFKHPDKIVPDKLQDKYNICKHYFDIDMDFLRYQYATKLPFLRRVKLLSPINIVVIRSSVQNQIGFSEPYLEVEKASYYITSKEEKIRYLKSGNYIDTILCNR